MRRLLFLSLVAASLELACSSCSSPRATSEKAPVVTDTAVPTQPTQGACLDPSAMSKERYAEVRAQFQANHYERDEVTEKALARQTGKTVECYRPGAGGQTQPRLGFEAPAGWSQLEASRGADGWMNPGQTVALQYSLTGPLGELPENFTDADLLRVVEQYAKSGMNLPPPSKTETGRTGSGLRYAGGLFTHEHGEPMWLWAVTSGPGPTIWVTLTGSSAGSSGQAELDAAHRFLDSLRLD